MDTRKNGPPVSRRAVLMGIAAASIAATELARPRHANSKTLTSKDNSAMTEDTISTADGIRLFYKDWGPKSAQPIVFSHGWPLSADDWDAQLMFFLNHGFRVIAHDRRGHGRSTQTADGHDMDHYADDLAALTAHLNLKKAVHIGHSTGGGEVARYIGRHGSKRVAKAVLLGAVAAFHLGRLRDLVRRYPAVVLGGVVVAAIGAEAWYLVAVHTGTAPDQAAAVARVADAVVVGSALVDEIAAGLAANENVTSRVLATARRLAQAVHAVGPARVQA